MTAHALLDCCVNREQIQSFMDFPGQKYKGIGSLERAATKIQATWLTYCARAHFKKIEPRLQALGLFFKRWTSHKRRALMRGSIKVLDDFHVKRAEVLMTILASEWETIKQSERVIVHIPSYETAKGIHEDFQHYIRQASFIYVTQKLIKY
jgi:hypothetical protein